MLTQALIHAQPYCTVYKDRVDTIIVTISFLTHFTYRFVLLCYTFICRTDTRVKCSFISGFVYHFTYHFIIVSNIVLPIYMFEYTVYIVDVELYGSLASL